MSNRLIIVGLCGAARSGKDTVAAHLVHEFGFTRIGLADGVRSAFRDIDGLTWERTKELEAAGKTTRWALQTLGTECREDLAKDSDDAHWVDHLLIKIRYLSYYHSVRQTRFVVPDIRFPFEAECIRLVSQAAFGAGKFCCWRIVRPGAGLSGDSGKHSSETGIGQIEYGDAIYNDGMIDQLRASTSAMTVQFLENQ